MENVTRCAVCGSENSSDFIECTDHFVSGENFIISSCDECGFCFTNPRPELSDSASYYESEKYISHSKTNKGLTNILFHQARKFTIRYKRNIAKKYSSAPSILDYGCGTGDFLHAMKHAGFNCTGLEPNATAREHAVSNYGLSVIRENELGAIADSSLGCISLWHVLEHVYPLEERLQQFYSKLQPGGTLIVAVPNMSSFDARKYKSHWAAYDVPRHIYHFTPETLLRLMERIGFAHIKTKPMRLDAFYISLLSEKYRHGHEKFISAFFTGLRSNFSACFGKGNYSSLIYIFKKSK
ncbi:MAG: class I SAM-dependent methyltransferase [Bacteroidota bacterium]